VLENVKRKQAVELSRHRSIEQVVNKNIEPPTRQHPPADIFDEYMIEIHRRQLFYLGLNDPRSKSVATADLQNAFPTCEHLGDKLVAREPKQKVFRIVVPALAAAQAERFKTALLGSVQTFLILRFTCSLSHVAASSP
jgi:hypothetical protein